MSKVTKALFCFAVLCGCFVASAQIGNYEYARELQDIKGVWNKIILPDNIFKDINRDFSDLRVYVVTAEKDTIEAPYILTERKTTDVVERREFELINESKRNGAYFFTFLRRDNEVINEIQLDFLEENYDRYIKLEGSDNNRDWYVILENYRILSISNEITKYTFNTLRFPPNDYKYTRLSFNSENRPALNSVSIVNKVTQPGKLKSYNLKNYKTANDKNRKKSVLNFRFDMKIPLSRLKILVNEKYDYFRPVRISVVSDSVKRDNKWVYIYRDILNGTINSRENNTFDFETVITNRVRITVNNHDNSPLTFNSVKAWGNIFELIIRTIEKGDYYLVYGKSNACTPGYDLTRFRESIPDNINLAKVNEKIIQADKADEQSPLFMQKIWLWLIIILVVVFLGGFTLRMMRKE